MPFNLPVTVTDVRNIIRAISVSDSQITDIIAIADVIVQEEIVSVSSEAEYFTTEDAANLTAIDVGNDIPGAPPLTISLNRLAIIERYLAAHLVALAADETRVKDQRAGGIRGVETQYTDVTGMGLKTTRFGQTAIFLDPTGKLRRLDAQGRAWFRVARTPKWTNTFGLY